MSKHNVSESDLPKIGKPATRALNAVGIQNLAQLSARTEGEIKKLHGMGPKALELLRQALTTAGLSFKP
jgi:hypothetical protein